MATLIAFWILLSVCSTWTVGQHDDDLHRYSNLWVAKVEGGEEVAKRVARDLGYTYNGQCGELEGYYEFTREDLPEMSLRDSGHLTSDLLDLDEVKWAKQQIFVRISSEGDSRQQIAERRDDHSMQYEIPEAFVNQALNSEKNSISSLGNELLVRKIYTPNIMLERITMSREPSETFTFYDASEVEAEQKYLASFLKDQVHKLKGCKSIFSCISSYPPRINTYFNFVEFKGQRDISELGTFSTKPAPSSQLYTYSKVTTRPINLLSLKVSAYILKHSDPYWYKQWYLQDYRTEDMPVMDLNVVPVHDRGITGEGIIVGVVDTGIEPDNFDIGDNLVSHLSYNYCKLRLTKDSPPKVPHGTSCAGVIAMKADNGECGVGIAYNAKVVGIRAVCEGWTCWSTISKGLVHGINEIDIYSSSWNVRTRGNMIYKRDSSEDYAVYEGTRKGRNKKGAIYVQSAGNDKDIHDNCAFDANVNSPYVITISSATQSGHIVYESERCTAIFATGYSTGVYWDGVVAPGLSGNCRSDFSGTSAACPQAAGIIALVLSANRHLTYRDVMHLITMSAEVAPLADNPNTWYKNGRGFWVSNDFGFGLMNAENMVNLAEKWRNVPEKRECRATITIGTVPISLGQDVDVPFDATACSGTVNEVRYLEQIEISPWVEFQVRGDINIYITSPSGTVTHLLEGRKQDKKPNSLSGLNIVSTHNWGEKAHGKWMVKFTINKSSDPDHKGFVKDFTVTFHGTKDKPAHYVTDRAYAAFRLPDGTTS